MAAEVGRGERGFLGCRDGDGYPGVNPPRVGLPNAYRTRHPALGNQLLSGFFVLSFSFSPSPPPSTPPPPVSVPLPRVTARTRSSLSRPPLGSLLRALSFFWWGPHFFWLRLRWVAPRPVYARPMRSATVVTPLPECSDSGGLPHRLLIGCCPSRSLATSHRSLAPSRRSPSPFSHSGCPSLSASRVYVSALALLFSSRILIFFINFSLRVLRTVLHLLLSFSLCPSHLVAVATQTWVFSP